MRKLILALCFLVTSVSAQTPFWVTGYYPTWWSGFLTPQELGYKYMTHIVIFPANSALTSSPWFDQSTFDAMGSELTTIISLAHANGCKVILSVVGGYGDQGMSALVANDANRQAFVNNSCAYALAKGADGIDLDWEFPQSGSTYGWNRLIAEYRAKLNTWSPHGVLTTSMFYSIGGSVAPPYYKDSMEVAFDQINLMSYTMWMGTSSGPFKSGYDTPINTPTSFSGYNGWSLSTSTGPLTYFQYYTPGKIGVGMSFEGTWFDQTTAFGTSYTSWGFCTTVNHSLSGSYQSIPTANRIWDSQAQANYVNGATRKFSFQDTNSLKAIVNWAKAQNAGGVMIYDLPTGYNGGSGYTTAEGPKDLLLQAVWKAAGGTGGGVITPPSTTTVPWRFIKKYH